MIFIANYWKDPTTTSVIVYTNCDNVELRLNDVLITNGGKERSVNSMHLLRPPYIFKIDQYIPGHLEAVGFIKNKPVVRTHRMTPGKIHHHLKIEIDFSGKTLTSNDIVFVYAYIYDENNVVIPDANDTVQFSLLNGSDQASFIDDNPVRAEAGIASILLKTNSKVSDKNMTVLAFSSTLKQQEARLVVDITQH